MRRLVIVMATIAFLLGLGAPAVLAADPAPGTRQLLVSVDRAVDIPAGEHVDTLIIVDADARVSGDVTSLVVVRGTATLTGATAGSLVVVNGHADLQAGTTVSGDIRTLDGTVSQAPGSTVTGSVRTLDADLAAIGFLLIPAFLLLLVGLGLAVIAAALLVAAFAARQVRDVESLIARQPGQVLVAGIAGSIGLPVLAVLLIVSVLGAPIGLALLFVLLPAVAFLAWIVAAIWVGDWILGRVRGRVEPGHPYLAAVVGVIVLAVAGALPFVTAVATLFGFGGLLLAAWRTLRPAASPLGDGTAVQPVASAS